MIGVEEKAVSYMTNSQRTVFIRSYGAAKE